MSSERLPMIHQVIDSLSKESVLTRGAVHQLIQELAQSRGEPLVRIAQPIRVALTGRSVSPPIDEVIEILGKERVIRRLQKAAEKIGQGSG